MAQIHGRINERLKDLDSLNATACEGLVEDLREISEILLWGEQNYHQELFDYFCEKDMLSSFVMWGNGENLCFCVNSEVCISI